MTVALDPEATSALEPPFPGSAATTPASLLSRYRWLALWFVALLAFTVLVGLPTSRTQIFVFTAFGLVAISQGTRSATWKRVLIDWVPFYLILTVYDALRGSANDFLMPHALPQIHFDRTLFGGEVPTVQLQHALYTPGVAHVWDYAAFGVYMTHFIVPFVIAGVLWHFNHERFRKFAFLFLTLTFAGFTTYLLYPAVPPWMASQNQQIQPTAKIIDEMWSHIGLANGSSVFSATGHFANPVAAMPSLHAAYPMLIALFFWPIVSRRWRPLLMLYPLAMGFTLVYTGEHYVIDILIGWAYAAVVYFAGSRVFAWWTRRRAKRRSAALASAA
jgi:hypothetical protein